jgi:hypothetical protein
MMIITVIVILFLIDLSLSDQIITANLGQDVTFSCLFENEFQFNQVRRIFSDSISYAQ